MSDDFFLMLEKLIDIQWDIITSIENLPNLPQKFNHRRITIQDDNEFVLPIQSLKNNR